MNSVKIYDNLLDSKELNYIKNNYYFTEETSATNILNSLDSFPKKEILYSLAFDFNNSISSPSVAHSIVIEEYSKKNKDLLLWEPHHDGKESKVITLVFIDIENTDKWSGGELDIYTSLDVFDYPNNKQRIEALPGRVVIFESSMIHCIRPYFGKTTRKSISIGWE